MVKQKDWVQKFHETKGFPKVEKLTGKIGKGWEIGTLTIPTPIEVNGLMKKIPKGKITTISQRRDAVAKKHEASVGKIISEIGLKYE